MVTSRRDLFRWFFCIDSTNVLIIIIIWDANKSSHYCLAAIQKHHCSFIEMVYYFIFDRKLNEYNEREERVREVFFPPKRMKCYSIFRFYGLWIWYVLTAVGADDCLRFRCCIFVSLVCWMECRIKLFRSLSFVHSSTIRHTVIVLHTKIIK